MECCSREDIHDIENKSSIDWIWDMAGNTGNVALINVILFKLNVLFLY